MSALKKIPRWTTDKAAEDWLQRANLADYDLSKAVPMAEFLEHAELVRKDKVVSLKLPARLHADAAARAKALNMPTQKFLRMAIANELKRA